MPERERVKDPCMVRRLGKDRRNGSSVVLIHVRHDDLGAVAFCLQREQKRLCARRANVVYRSRGKASAGVGARLLFGPHPCPLPKGRGAIPQQYAFGSPSPACERGAGG